MKKVILNKCYGGFDLSDLACKLYFEKTGLDIHSIDDDTSIREDLILIDIVETLGSRANTIFSNLVIVEIPYNLDYVIDDYDGFETLHQKVQEW